MRWLVGDGGIWSSLPPRWLVSARARFPTALADRLRDGVERQRDRLAPALTAADPAVAAAFRTVMRAIMDDSARDYLDAAHPVGGDKADADGR